MGIDFTHLFTPTFLVELRSGFSRDNNHQNGIWGGIDVASQIGLPDSTHDTDLIGFPLFNVTDYASLGGAANEPVQFAVTDIQIRRKFTWVKARHVMKWGYEYDRTRFNQPYFNNNRGTFNFNGSGTTALRWPISCWAVERGHAHGRLEPQLPARHQHGRLLQRRFQGAAEPHAEPGNPLRDRHDSHGPLQPHDEFRAGTRQGRAGFQRSQRDGCRSPRPACRTASLMPMPSGLPRSLVNPDYNNFAPRVGLCLDALEQPQDRAARRLRHLLYGLAVESVPQQSAEHVPLRADGNLHRTSRPGPIW